jgi:hypothetical protein
MKHSKICVFNELTARVDRVENFNISGFGEHLLMTSVVKNLVLVFVCIILIFEKLKLKFRPI